MIEGLESSSGTLSPSAELLLGSLVADQALPAEIAGVILASIESDESLREHLAGGLPAKTVPEVVTGDTISTLKSDGAYLESLTVEGFRGIGPKQKIDFVPGNGLTLITGRNGSGKSSFAEGAEALVLGESTRWLERTADWKRGWRNLHHESAQIEAHFTIPGRATSTVVRRVWKAGEVDPSISQLEVQEQGSKLDRPDALGWTRALTVYRPFLSYNDLSRLFDSKPSELFDSISRLLLLDDLPTIEQRLANTRKEAEAEAKRITVLRTQLDALLAASTDARAGRIREALGTKKMAADLTLLDELTRSVEEESDIGLLRRLSELNAPDRTVVLGVVAEIQAINEANTELAKGSMARDLAIAELLDHALIVHGEGDGSPSCPVCDTPGVITSEWKESASIRAKELRNNAREVEAGKAALQRQRSVLEDALTIPPSVVDAAKVGINEAVALLGDWSHLIEVARSVESDLESSLAAVESGCETLRTRSVADFERSEVLWRPLRDATIGWRVQVDASTKADQDAKLLKKASEWVATAGNELRNRKFGEIKHEVLGFWSQLRMSSSVELRDLSLAGKNTSRQLQLDVSVDNVDGVALSVVSQGELHALALSLFLPRALRPDSPFRFLIIDDPVQAMDPVRVEGLARVLAEVAKVRQVIVLTHDERLSAAIQRLQIPATELRIVRSAKSLVKTEIVRTHSDELLRQAAKIATSDKVTPEVARRVVGGFLRMSLESLAAERFTQRRLKSGALIGEIEQQLLDASKLVERLAQARGCLASELYAKLNRSPGPWSVELVKSLNSGSHGVLDGSLRDHVDNVRKLADAVRTW
jgi:hypothetical protein